MHSLKMIHRNLNTSNILISKDGAVKVSGLRYSADMNTSNLNASVITETNFKDFIAPEIDSDLNENERKA